MVWLCGLDVWSGCVVGSHATLGESRESLWSQAKRKEQRSKIAGGGAALVGPGAGARCCGGVDRGDAVTVGVGDDPS